MRAVMENYDGRATFYAVACGARDVGHIISELQQKFGSFQLKLSSSNSYVPSKGLPRFIYIDNDSTETNVLKQELLEMRKEFAQLVIARDMEIELHSITNPKCTLADLQLGDTLIIVDICEQRRASNNTLVHCSARYTKLQIVN